MATAKRTTAKKKAAAARSSRAGSTGRQNITDSRGFQTEIILILILGATALMVISNFGIGGFVGNTISSALFGVMGAIAYAFPFLFFLAAVFLMANKGNRLAGKKIIAALVLFLVLCGLIQLLTEGYLPNASFADNYAVGSDYHSGGGVIGGAISKSTTAAFGIAGSYVILILMILVCLINMTQRSFFGFFYRIGDLIRQGAQNRRESRAFREPEREMKREIRQKEKERKRKERQAVRMQRLEEAMEREDEIQRQQEFDIPVIPREKKTSEPGKKRDAVRLDYDETEETPIRKRAGRKNKSRSGQKLDELERYLDQEEKEERSDTRLIGDTDVVGEQTQFTFQINRPQTDVSEEEETPFPDPIKAETPIEDDPYADAAAKQPEELAEEAKAEETVVKKRQPSKNTKSSQEEIAEGIQDITKEIQKKEPPRVYQYPPLKLLKRGDGGKQGDSDEELRQTAQKLQEILETFGVHAKVTNVSCGPTVTQYELQPEMGVKVSRIVNLADDIKLNLATSDIRIEAPIPGKAAVGIEVPNKKSTPVMLRELLQSSQFQEASSRMTFAVGKDIAGNPVVADIAKMPHLLIAGATGSGKSVCINTVICSLLYKASPDEVKMIMVDPKVVELSVYNGIPHLLIPVVTDPKKAAGALNWAVTEMMNRYNVFAEYTVRNISEYNRKVEQMTIPEGEQRPDKMPQILIIVDELADLMMVSPGEVEDAIVRLTQLARAAGIHLIIATQRPSVNVITGLIKANMPSRIAFAVSSGVDSRTILDTVGAEKLLGHGDMLFYPQGYNKPARLQGAFVSDEEVSSIVAYIADKNPKKAYDADVEEKVTMAMVPGSTAAGAPGASGGEDGRDPYFAEAGKFIIEKEKASIGMLQRMFRIGFNRAARIMDQLCEAGVVGPEEGTKPRKILMSQEEFEVYLEEHV